MVWVYIFLSNMVMDVLMFSIAAAIMRIYPNKLRITISSAVGAVYSLGQLYFVEFEAVFLKICLFFVMVLIAFKFENPVKFIKKCLFFLLSTIIVGGAAALLFRENIYAAIVIPSAALAMMPMSARLVRLYRKEYIKSKALRTLEIDHNGTKYRINAFADTGNMLYEPNSGCPVVIVENRMFGDSYLDTLADQKLSVLPFSTLSGEKRAIIAFKPDSAYLDGTRIDCLVGLYNGKLSDQNDYNALINPLMV